MQLYDSPRSGALNMRELRSMSTRDQSRTAATYSWERVTGIRFFARDACVDVEPPRQVSRDSERFLEPRSGGGILSPISSGHATSAVHLGVRINAAFNEV